MAQFGGNSYTMHTMVLVLSIKYREWYLKDLILKVTIKGLTGFLYIIE